MPAVRTDLGNGDWAEIRPASELLAGDKDAWDEAMLIDFTMDPETGQPSGRQRVSLGMMNRQRDILLSRVTVAWSLPLPLPADDPSAGEDGEPLFAESLKKVPLAAFQALEAAVKPHMAALRGGPDPKEATTSPSSNGSKGPPGRSSRPASHHGGRGRSST